MRAHPSGLVSHWLEDTIPWTSPPGVRAVRSADHELRLGEGDEIDSLSKDWRRNKDSGSSVNSLLEASNSMSGRSPMLPGRVLILLSLTLINWRRSCLPGTAGRHIAVHDYAAARDVGRPGKHDWELRQQHERQHGASQNCGMTRHTPSNRPHLREFGRMAEGER